MAGSKRRGDADWPAGRGGMSGAARNTPGGRGLGSRIARDKPGDDMPPGTSPAKVGVDSDWWRKPAQDPGDEATPGSSPAKDPVDEKTPDSSPAKVGAESYSSAKDHGDVTPLGSSPAKVGAGSGSLRSQANKPGDDTPPGISPAKVGAGSGSDSDSWRKSEKEQSPPIPSSTRRGPQYGIRPPTRSDASSWKRASPEPTSPFSGSPSLNNSPISPPHQPKEQSPPIPSSRRGGPQFGIPPPTRSDAPSWKRDSPEPTSPFSGSPSLNNSRISPHYQPRSPSYQFASASSSQTGADAPSWKTPPRPSSPPRLPLSKEVLKRFSNFLNRYQLPGDNGFLYKAHIPMLRQLERPKLSVDFGHLMSWDQSLARDICNGQQSDGWLMDVPNLFFAENGFATEKAAIHFLNMPTRVTKGATAFVALGLLLTKVKLFGKVDSLVATFRCSQACRAIISVVFASIASGMSWQGNLTPEDVDFIERGEKIEAVITKEPVVHSDASAEDKILDVHSLWPVIKPIVTMEDKMPAYFDRLKEDLENATADLLNQAWFFEYIEHHLSLMPSMGRKNLEIGTYHVMDQWKMHQYSELKPFFGAAPQGSDWRDLASSNDFLKRNFNHAYWMKTQFPAKEKIMAGDRAESTSKGKGDDGNTKELADTDIVKTFEDLNQAGVSEGEELVPFDGKTQAPEKEEFVGDGAEVVISEGKEEGGNAQTKVVVAGEESSKKPSFDPKTLVGNDEWKEEAKNTHDGSMWGLLKFRRDVHSHPGMDEIWDVDEVEIFLVNLGSDFLPRVIRKLLRTGIMNGRLASVWSSYKSAKSDSRRLPANVVKTWR